MDENLWLSILGNSAGTLLATIVGAVVALIGARALHARESKARYEEALDDGVAMLVEEASLHRRAALDWRNRNSLRLWALRRASEGPIMPDPAPSLARFLALVQVVVLRTRRSDRGVMLTAADAALRLIRDDHAEESAERAFELATVLVSWRMGGMVAFEATREIDRLAVEWSAQDNAKAEATRSEESDE